jgi:hypothetical protein
MNAIYKLEKSSSNIQQYFMLSDIHYICEIVQGRQTQPATCCKLIQLTANSLSAIILLVEVTVGG